MVIRVRKPSLCISLPTSKCHLGIVMQSTNPTVYYLVLKCKISYIGELFICSLDVVNYYQIVKQNYYKARALLSWG